MPSATTNHVDDLTRGLPRIKPPTASEERELARRWREEGDVAARNELWTRNLPWAIRRATQYHVKFRITYPKFTFEDALGAAAMGIGRAITTFDPDKGRFTTHSRSYVDRFLEDACADSLAIRLPKWVWELRKKSYKHPELSLKPGERKCLESAAKSMVAGPDVSGEPVNLACHETIEDDPEEHTRMIGKMRDAVARLLARDREIVERFFGLNGREREALKAIGDDMGYSKEGIRLIKNRALETLRRMIDPHHDVA